MGAQSGWNDGHDLDDSALLKDIGPLPTDDWLRLIEKVQSLGLKAKPEIGIRVKCDVHPWMSSMFVVLDHPYFAVTKDDGTYTISGLPPGNYTITAWHEMEDKIETAEQQIKVEPGKPTEANFNLKLK